MLWTNVASASQGLSRENYKKLFVPMFNSWCNCPLRSLLLWFSGSELREFKEKHHVDKLLKDLEYEREKNQLFSERLAENVKRSQESPAENLGYVPKMYLKLNNYYDFDSILKKLTIVVSKIKCNYFSLFWKDVFWLPLFDLLILSNLKI